MSIWATTPVTQEPDIVLVRWQVIELPDGDRHFVGYNGYGQEGRVSSLIVDYNKEAKMGKTRSGRTYHLKGEPSSDSDAIYVWEGWCRINSVDPEDPKLKNVSNEY